MRSKPIAYVTNSLRCLCFPALSITVGVVSLLIVLAIAGARSIDFGFLTRDLAQLFQAPPYYGFLSNMGILFWMASATVTAFGTALVAGVPEAGNARNLLSALTILSSALCLDDFFVLHESIPVSEKYFFGSYALFLVLIVLRWRSLLKGSPAPYLVLAGFFFLLSLAIDLRQVVVEAAIGQYRILLEDGAKFAGVVFWINFSWKIAFQEVARYRPLKKM